MDAVNNIENLLKAYNSLNLHGVVDYDRFNHYAITHHSTVIEGATLTENETRLLLEEGLTPKGKPLQHSLMVKNHYEALEFILQNAINNTPITTTFIQNINAAVMKQTGSVYNTALGQVDASKGEYRKGNVSAGGTYFINYDKVPTYVDKMLSQLNERLVQVSSVVEQLELSFSAHFSLVSIHPFYDGNGRTSRLLMNYLQALFQLPLAIVFKESKVEYFTALQQARKQESSEPFYTFMFSQYAQYLQEEINVYQKAMQQDLPKNNNGFSIFF